MKIYLVPLVIGILFVSLFIGCGTPFDSLTLIPTPTPTPTVSPSAATTVTPTSASSPIATIAPTPVSSPIATIAPTPVSSPIATVAPVIAPSHTGTLIINDYKSASSSKNASRYLITSKYFGYGVVQVNSSNDNIVTITDGNGNLVFNTTVGVNYKLHFYYYIRVAYTDTDVYEAGSDIFFSYVAGASDTITLSFDETTENFTAQLNDVLNTTLNIHDGAEYRHPVDINGDVGLVSRIEAYLAYIQNSFVVGGAAIGFSIP